MRGDIIETNKGGIMFVKLENGVRINISLVAQYSDVSLVMEGSVDELALSEKDIELLDSLLIDQDVWTPPTHGEEKKSEMGDFITKLHKLTGGRGEAKLTTDRRARLTTRLKDFSKDELITAATNLGSDEFMQGANDNGKRYGTIDYLLRTSANVNKWLEAQPGRQKSMF